MSQSIETKYYGPSTRRQSRIKATASGGFSRTYPYRHELSLTANHNGAAHALACELQWDGVWTWGTTKGNGFVYVNAQAGAAFIVEPSPPQAAR